MSRLRLPWLGAASLVLLGALLPRSCFNPLPRAADLPAPGFDGLVLLQATLVLTGLGVALASWTFRRYEPIAARDLLPAAAPAAYDISPQATWLALGAITAVGAVLRLWHVGSELWLDELTPLQLYGKASVVQVLTSYVSSNNHVMNTLLVKLSTAVFGENEWAVRLPAVLFGIGGIPAMWAVARAASLDRLTSLGAAALLAGSYHHVFFSQNARGYAAYLTLSLVATALLVRGLTRDRARDWGMYALVMGLDFAAHLVSALVFSAHILVGLGAVAAVRSHGGRTGPLLRRLAVVFLATGWLSVLLYASVVPQILVYQRVVYHQASAGHALLSTDFVAEVARGLLAGLPPRLWVLAGAAAFLGLLGFAALVRRSWVVAAALTLPLVLQAVLAVLGGTVTSPRFFLLALPLGILAGLCGIAAAAEIVARSPGSRASLAKGAMTGAVVVGSLVSLGTLRHYYAAPKQAHQAALRWIAGERRNHELLVVIHLAEAGSRYYGDRLGWNEGHDYVFVRSVAALDEALAAHPGREPMLLTTFARALHIEYPELEARIQRDFVEVRRFPATVGDGQMVVWRSAGSWGAQPSAPGSGGP